MVLGLVVVPLVCNTASADLVNHWTFDNADTLGLVANDTAGNFANDATYQDGTGAGMSFGATGLMGEAFDFTGANGTNKVFQVLNDANGSMEISGLTTISLSLWVRPELTQAGNNTGIY